MKKSNFFIYMLKFKNNYYIIKIKNILDIIKPNFLIFNKHFYIKSIVLILFLKYLLLKAIK